MSGFSLRERLERRRGNGSAARKAAASNVHRQVHVATSTLLEHTPFDEKCIRAYCKFMLDEEKPKAKTSLPQLKRFARISNFEKGWQAIRGKAHTKKLRDQLLTVRDALHEAKRRVLLSRAHAKKQLGGAISKSFEGRRRKGRGKKRKRAAGEQDGEVGGGETARTLVETASRAVFHFVPSGCGIVIGTERGARLLTCTHCVDHDDDNDEEGEDVQGVEEDGGKGGGGGVASGAGSVSAAETKRVGRLKFFLMGDGKFGLAVCTASSERMDVALLEVVASQIEAGVVGEEDDDDDEDDDVVLVKDSSSSAAAAAAAATTTTAAATTTATAIATIATTTPTPGIPVVCVHNPYFVDLETSFDNGAEEWEKDTGFLPFSADAGRITGFRDGDRTDATRFGAAKHSCWT